MPASTRREFLNTSAMLMALAAAPVIRACGNFEPKPFFAGYEFLAISQENPGERLSVNTVPTIPTARR